MHVEFGAPAWAAALSALGWPAEAVGATVTLRRPSGAAFAMAVLAADGAHVAFAGLPLPPAPPAAALAALAARVLASRRPSRRPSGPARPPGTPRHGGSGHLGSPGAR